MRKLDNLIIWLFAIVIFLVHQIFFHGGYFGFDELTYSALANDFFKGELEKDLNLFSYRLSIIVPLAISYLIFGVNDWANMMPSFITLLIILAILLRLLDDQPKEIKWVCAVYFICFPIHLMYLSKPMPDLIVELGFLLCFVALYKTYFLSNKKHQLNWILFLFGGILIFLAKETFLIIYPFFLFAMLKDWKRGDKKSFWLKITVSLGLFVAAYFFYYYISKGNPFIRVDAIFHERYISECSYDFQPLSVLLHRISYELWLEFMRNGVLLPIGFLILLKRRYSLSPAKKFILKSYIFALLLSNFMTISYTSYVPLCHDVRHFLFVFPLAVLTLGIGLFKLKNLDFKAVLIIAGSIILQGIIAEYWFPETYWTIFSAIGFGLVLYYWKLLKVLGLSLIFVGLGLQFIYNAKYNLKTNHPAQKQLIEYVIRQPGTKIVITDSANSRLGKMYAQYNSDEIEFIRYQEYSSFPGVGELPTFVILNGMTAWFSKVNWAEVPDEVKEDSEKLKLLFNNEAGKVFEYIK